MTIILLPGESDYRSISIATRDNKAIDNQQDRDPVTEPYRVEAYRQRVKFEGMLTANQCLCFRAGPTPMYNCHGLTFASRRTKVPDPQEVVRILKADGYIKVAELDTLPGDVVLYKSDNGEIEHSGIVIGDSKAGYGVPIIVSKWGQLNEAIHSADVGPYTGERSFYRIIDESPTYRPEHV